jgi:hypothetical protein
MGPRAGLDVLEKINALPLPGFKPRILQPVAYCCIGCHRNALNKTKYIESVAGD